MNGVGVRLWLRNTKSYIFMSELELGCGAMSAVNLLCMHEGIYARTPEPSDTHHKLHFPVADLHDLPDG